MLLLTLILGSLCVVYGTIVIFILGFFELQNYIWYFFALYFFILGRFTFLYTKTKIPLWPLVSGYTMAALGILIFVITGVITTLSLPDNDERGLDFLIVLGTKPDVDKSGSEVLYRLDKAVAYIEENSATNLVISGGLKYEGNVESVIMANYLIEEGVDPEKILLEIESHNTRENLLYSKALIDQYITAAGIADDIAVIDDIGPVLVVEDRPKTIGILTNDFHIFRAMQVAKKMGMDEVYPISSKSNKILYIHMLMRETFAILKYKFFEYM